MVGLHLVIPSLDQSSKKVAKAAKAAKVYVASAQLNCDHFGCLRPLDAKHCQLHGLTVDRPTLSKRSTRHRTARLAGQANTIFG
jgi:hypothetical protein